LTVLARLPTRSDVARADLFGIHLVNAALKWSDLSGFVLMGANLQQANLLEARLRGARVDGAHVQGADLEGADLREACLERADLRGATLKRAHLGGAQLKHAHLEGVDLTAVRGLTREQLEQALLDARTLLPLELQQPSSTDAPESG
jgi:uncharacterized protein YjbI with pentapeptide repeats